TLDEEVGRVMMVGFEGPLADPVLADWKQRQFGGLLIVNLNHNATSDAGMSSLITSIRGTSRHRLIAATDQEGGAVCLAAASAPCSRAASRRFRPRSCMEPTSSCLGICSIRRSTYRDPPTSRQPRWRC